MIGISADADTLVQQAGATARTYLNEAMAAVRDRFGPVADPEHVALVGVFMQVAAADFQAAMNVVAAQNIHDGLMAISASLESGLKIRR